ncbi:MAG TPA: hypothetical protein VLA09_12750 [Longimicrobiales bacterium]|nr:hypothetical protein [Longimicrobiales bacterium]
MSDRIRVCGPCSACCTVMGVPEIGKGTHEICAHLCGAGCAIYADRPGSCRAFDCQWLRGVLEVDETVDNDLRPDSCGVIFDYRPDTAFGDVYMAWEVEPGASDGGHAREIIDGLQEASLVMTMRPPPDGEKELDAPGFVGPTSTAPHAPPTR